MLDALTAENVEPVDAEPQVDRAEELREKWGVELGDLWELDSGKGYAHRLICGDCTDKAVVEKAFDIQPEIMVTDPPYGVEYDPSWRADAGVNHNDAKMGKVENDDIADWTPAWQLFDGDVAYVYHAGIMSGIVQRSLESCGFIARSQIIWNKDRMALSRGDYHWKHEPCWYVVRKGKLAKRTDDRTQVTVWDIPARDDSGHGHGTQKPIECMERPIRNHNFEVVYDPFLGSGTTLIACERSNAGPPQPARRPCAWTRPRMPCSNRLLTIARVKTAFAPTRCRKKRLKTAFFPRCRGRKRKNGQN